MVHFIYEIRRKTHLCVGETEKTCPFMKILINTDSDQHDPIH